MCKSIGSMDHHSLTWLLTHRQIHLCYSILYSPLSTFTFLFWVLGPPCRFSQSHGSQIQNRLKKFRSAKLQFQQFGTKIIQSFNIAPLHPASFHKHTEPENRLRKFGGAKVQFQQCRRKVLSSFSLPFQHCTFAPCKFSQSHRPRK